jgi:hypothetical protein
LSPSFPPVSTLGYVASAPIPIRNAWPLRFLKQRFICIAFSWDGGINSRPDELGSGFGTRSPFTDACVHFAWLYCSSERARTEFILVPKNWILNLVRVAENENCTDDSQARLIRYWTKLAEYKGDVIGPRNLSELLGF